MRSLLRSVTLAVALVLAAACGGRGSGGPLPGAGSAREAVDEFMSAVKAQDLQALASIWGTEKGPARDQMDRRELERRELLMMCYLTHDTFAVQQETGGAMSTRVFRITLTKGSTTRPSAITTIRGPSERWYVQDADLTQLQAFCNRR